MTSGHPSAAFLGITDPEPLLPEHPLWTEPKISITPKPSAVREDLSRDRSGLPGSTPGQKV